MHQGTAHTTLADPRPVLKRIRAYVEGSSDLARRYETARGWLDMAETIGRIFVYDHCETLSRTRPGETRMVAA